MRHRIRLFMACILSLLLLPVFAGKDKRVGSLSIELGPEVRLIEGGRFPYLFRSREGTLALLASVPGDEDDERQARSPNGVPRTVLSKDNGKTWHQWRPQPGQGLGPMMEGAAVQTRDGSILVFDYIPESKGNGKLVNRRWQSTDQWTTFLGPQESYVEVAQAIDGGIADNGQPIAPILFHRSVLELPGGDLLAGLYGWFKGDDSPSEYRFEMKKFRSLLLRSRDQGRHWKYVSTIAVDPNARVGHQIGSCQFRVSTVGSSPKDNACSFGMNSSGLGFLLASHRLGALSAGQTASWPTLSENWRLDVLAPRLG